MLPYLDDVAGALLPQLTCQLPEAARTAAVCSLSMLLSVALSDGANAGRGQAMYNAIMPGLLGLIAAEKESELLATACEAFQEIARLCRESGRPPRAGPTPSDLAAVVTGALAGVAASGRRLLSPPELAVGDDEGEEEEEDEEGGTARAASLEADVCTTLMQGLGNYVRAYGAGVVPVLEHCGGSAQALAFLDSPCAEVVIAGLSLFDDLFEFALPDSLVYFRAVAPRMLAACAAPVPGVRQCAVFGVGVMARCCGADFEALVPDAVRALLGVVTAKVRARVCVWGEGGKRGRVATAVLPPLCAQGAREGDSAPPTDNAISALISLCRHRAHLVAGADSLLDDCLGALPLLGDTEEACVVHRIFFEMLGEMDPRVAGNTAKLAQSVDKAKNIVGASPLPPPPLYPLWGPTRACRVVPGPQRHTWLLWRTIRSRHCSMPQRLPRCQIS